MTKNSPVTLREITGETVVTICKLKVSPDQEGFVATNALSIAQAHFDPDAWFRAIYADETPIGFVMVDDDIQKKEYFLWRFMIDERYQRMGLGRSLFGHVVRRFLEQGITTMTLSEDAGNPSCRFYLSFGSDYQRDDRGRPHLGSFIWRDLEALARDCPADL